MNIPIILLMEIAPDRKHYHYIKVSVNFQKNLKYVNITPRHVLTHVLQMSLEQIKLHSFLVIKIQH